MTAHFDQKISFLTSFTQTPEKNVISSLKNSDDFFIVISTPNRRVFTTFPQQNLLFLPSFFLFSFSSLKNSDDFFSCQHLIHLFLNFFPLTLDSSLQK